MTIIGTGLHTHFASPERASDDIVRGLSEELQKGAMLTWFDSMPMGMTIVNQHRQILYCNTRFQEVCMKQNINDILGLRPGEALSCVNAALEDAGCGCSDFCSVCGAAKAIVKSLEGTADCQECRLTRLVHGAEVPLDLQVFTSPIEFQGNHLSIVFVMDISHELKLRYLNRTFHHGLINGVGGIAVLTELIESDSEDSSLFPLLIESSRRTLRDVLYHRDVTAAEEGRLSAEIETFEAGPFFHKMITEECLLRNTQPECTEVLVTADTITSDKRLLSHAVRNMLSNALEAREANAGTIRLLCDKQADGTIRLSMSNPGEIPALIKKQIFKRYVSTKSKDRGLGNYVTKLFVEKHLGGTVSFESGNGMTTFTIILPGKEQ